VCRASFSAYDSPTLWYDFFVAILKEKFTKFEAWFDKYDRHISSAGLLLGFIVDSLTLRRIDLPLENAILFSYIFLGGFGLIIINMFEAGRWTGTFMQKVRKWMPLVIQYAFGGLFSAFFIFYSRSASFGSSWPFVIVLVGLLIGNELFKKSYVRLGFQTSVYFMAVFSYLIFVVPILVNRIGAHVFLLSGILSLVFIWYFIKLLLKIVPDRIREAQGVLIVSIGCIYAFMNIFYFTNIIPPIPLSLKAAGMYHELVKLPEGGYVAEQEARPWYAFFRRFPEYHLDGEPVYAYSRIFAPTDISTTIVHEWQKRNEDTDSWETRSRISFKIDGGSGVGYRGYTLKEAVDSGLWRVNIKTTRGQVLGRIKFRAIENSPNLQLESVTL